MLTGDIFGDKIFPSNPAVFHMVHDDLPAIWYGRAPTELYRCYKDFIQGSSGQSFMLMTHKLWVLILSWILNTCRKKLQHFKYLRLTDFWYWQVYTAFARLTWKLLRRIWMCSVLSNTSVVIWISSKISSVHSLRAQKTLIGEIEFLGFLFHSPKWKRWIKTKLNSKWWHPKKHLKQRRNRERVCH